MKAALVLAAAAALGGCRLWYRPVPIANAIGDERTTIAGDTFSVHRDGRFEVYGPGPQAVFDGYEQLNRTYRAFDRYFGAPAPRLAVIMFTQAAGPADSAMDRAFRDRGLSVLLYTRPRRVRLLERLGGEAGYEGALWPVGPAAARVMLASLVSPMAMPSAPLDTSALVRFPAWYRSAVMSVVGDAGSLPTDVAYTRENRGSRLTLEELVTQGRQAAADSTLDPSRRGETDDHDRRFASEASALAQFLLEREGPAVLGRLGRGYASGRSFEQMAMEFRSTPRALADLEERWMAWLEAQRTPY